MKDLDIDVDELEVKALVDITRKEGENNRAPASMGDDTKNLLVLFMLIALVLAIGAWLDRDGGGPIIPRPTTIPSPTMGVGNEAELEAELAEGLDELAGRLWSLEQELG